jgi:Ca2+-binding EF-hand superfamily protein
MDGDGKVSKAEWQNAVFTSEKLLKFFGGATRSEVKAAFDILDKSGKGAVSWYDVQTSAKSFLVTQGLASAVATEKGKAELKAFFNSIDSNQVRL